MGQRIRRMYNPINKKFDKDLIIYIVTQIDKDAIDKEIYIHICNEYKDFIPNSLTRKGIYVSYEIYNSGYLNKIHIEYELFFSYKKEYKEKIRLNKINKLIKN